MGRFVTQHDPDSAPVADRRDPPGLGGDLTPAVPPALELQRRCGWRQAEDMLDSSRKWMGHQRIRGRAFGATLFASSALPIGLPNRV